MKIFVKNNLFGFLLGFLLCSGIVYAATLYNASDITYKPTDASWEVSNVSEALNVLKNKLDDARGIENMTLVTTLSESAGYTFAEEGQYMVVSYASKWAHGNMDNSLRRPEITHSFTNATEVFSFTTYSMDCGRYSSVDISARGVDRITIVNVQAGSVLSTTWKNTANTYGTKIYKIN